MTLFSGEAIVVSLPAAELSGLALDAPMLTAEQALNLPVSRTLLCALALVESHCQERGISTTYLARPEIYTHGRSADWLRSRLGNVRQHLCLSDASAVKLIAGCQTHMFLYRLSYYDSYASFLRLTRRAPELLNQVFSQVNSSLGWGTAGERIEPASLYLNAVHVPDPPAPALYRFRFSPFDAESTAQDILEASDRLSLDDIVGASVVSMPLTETGLHDSACARSLARHVLKAFFTPNLILLLGLPSERAGESLAARIARVLQALAKTDVVLPRNSPRNVFFVTSDLPTGTGFSEFKIVLNESFNFWRHPRIFYDAAASIHVEAAAGAAVHFEMLPKDVTPIYGDRATRVWLDERGLARPFDGSHP